MSSQNQQHETVKKILPGAYLQSNGNAPPTWRIGDREFCISTELEVYEILDTEDRCLGSFPGALKLFVDS